MKTKLMCLAPVLTMLVYSVRAEDRDLNSRLPDKLKEFWDLTETRKTPLAPEIVYEALAGEELVQGLYFTSTETAHGPNRVYCGYARPIISEARKPVLVIVHGGGGHGTTDTAWAVCKLLKVPVISFDWGGPTEGRRFGSECVEPPPGQSPPIGQQSFTWQNVTAIRRTLDLAATLPGVDPNHVVVLGGSWGSYYSHFVAGLDVRVTDFVGNSGAGGWDDSYSTIAAGIHQLDRETQNEFYETFDPIVYAPYSRARVTMLAPTNDDFFWFGGLQRHFRAYSSSREKRLIAQANSNHGSGGYPNPVNTDPVPVALLKYHLFDEDPFPLVERGPEQKGATITWDLNGGQSEQQTGILYWSPSQVNWRSRYWIPIPAKHHDDQWTAALPTTYAGIAGSMMATVLDGPDRGVSTLPIAATGARDPALESISLLEANHVWDEHAGALAWRPTDTYHLTVEIMDHGPGGLELRLKPNQQHFSILTNSVVMSSGQAHQYKGLNLEIDGQGEAGSLLIRLRRDTCLADFETCETEIAYPADASVIHVQWSRFRKASKTNRAAIWPFDGLTLDGDRHGSAPLLIKSIRYMN